MTGCKGKIRYFSEKTAENQIVRVQNHGRKEHKSKKKFKLNSYKCEHCGFWHIGHSKWKLKNVNIVGSVTKAQ